MTIQSIREALEKSEAGTWSREVCVCKNIEDSSFIASAPEMIAFLLDRVEELEEKAWRYDSLNK